MLSLIQSLIPQDTQRAYVLAAARHIATFISGLVLAYLLKHGVDTTDAGGIAQDVGGLVVLSASVGFSMIDVKKVDKQVQTTQAQAAQQVANAAQAGPDQLQAALAKLTAGQA